MPASMVRLETHNASKYLQQLCKHWSHRFSVEYTKEKGAVDFGGEALDLSADADGLVLVARSSGDPVSHVALEGVIAEHLQRFAFRETFELTWSRVDFHET